MVKMADEGQGWFREYPEHALAGRGIPLGRQKKKKGALDVISKPEIEAPPLAQALIKPIYEGDEKPQLIIPEQRIDVPPEQLGDVVETIAGKKGQEGEGEGLNVFGINLSNPETAFTDFFGGLGEMFAFGSEQTGEAIGMGLTSPYFPSDDSAKKTIAGDAGDLGKNETFSIAEEAFGAKTLDDSFNDMAKTKIEVGYTEEGEDELDSQARAEEESQKVKRAQARGDLGEEIIEAEGYIGKEALKGAAYVGKEAAAGAKYLEGKLAEKAKAGFEALKDRFRRETGREPTPDEEDRMAEDITNQIVAENGLESPETPEAIQPAVAEPPSPYMPITPEGYIPEEQAQEMVEDLRRQKIIKNGNSKNGARL